jgi:hypothetical protein
LVGAGRSSYAARASAKQVSPPASGGGVSWPSSSDHLVGIAWNELSVWNRSAPWASL